MKHARPDYDDIQDPTYRIPRDEPVFLLRASDRAAAATVEHWADIVEEMGGQANIVAAAREQAAEMRRFREMTGGGKIPDMP